MSDPEGRNFALFGLSLGFWGLGFGGSEGGDQKTQYCSRK